MTDTEAALLRAIAAQPDEDTPRLIYADYLDEEGGPSQVARAEFVRLQMRLCRLPPDHPERAPTAARAQHLLNTWDVAWQTEMPPGFTRLAYYRRGFPYRAALTASLADGTDDPRLCSFEYLELLVDVPPTELAAVLRWPIFGRVKELMFRGNRIWGTTPPLDEIGAVALATEQFPRLERLSLAGHSIGTIGLEALAQARGFPKLRELDVYGNGIPAAARQQFRRSKLFAQLTRFQDGGNPPP